MERKRGRWNWDQVEQARSEAPAETVEEGTGSPSWLICHVRRVRAFSSLLIRNYRILWSATMLYMAAMQGNFVAQSWLAYHLTGSGVALALVALALNLPQFILSPFAGAVADRFDKRVVLIATVVALAACTAVNGLLVQLGSVTIWYLVAIALGQGIAYPFSLPTRTAFISDLVSERQLPNALAMDATSKNLDRIFAPTLAGVLIA
jgi:MFS family permease